MKRKEFEDFLEAQREEISRHRWIENEKAGRDLGQGPAQDWILRYAEAFRKWWFSREKDDSK